MARRQAGDLEFGFSEVLQRHPTVHLVTDHSIPIPSWLLHLENRRPRWLREMAAEAMGVCVRSMLGGSDCCGGGAFATLFFTTVEKELNLGQLLTVGLGYALGIAFGLIVSVMTSGGHLNPAVTITFALTGRFPWRKVPQYIIAQLFGGFLAVIWIYGIWNQTFKQIAVLFQAGNLPLVSATGPASVFVVRTHVPLPALNRQAVPVAGQNAGSLFATEFLVDAFLGLIIFAVLDPNNALIAPSSAPFAIGLAYAAMIWGFGLNTISTNMAKDLGGRFGAAIFFGREVFTTPTLPGYAALSALVNIPATVFAWLAYNLICGNTQALIDAGHGIDPELHRVLESERVRRRNQGLPAESTGEMVKRLTAGNGREVHVDSDKRS